MYIFNPEYSWLLIYSATLGMFVSHSIFNRLFKQDFIFIFVLIVLIITNLPIEKIQNFSEKNAITIHEILLFVSSFGLIFARSIKKLLLYVFCLAFYFSMLSLSHALHAESIIIPGAALVFLFGLHKTHSVLAQSSFAKNNKYFIVVLLFVLHNLIQYSGSNNFYIILYTVFAIYLAGKAYFENAYHHKIFYTFFAFFVLIASYIFTQNYVTDAINSIILYSTIAYFAYSTIGIQYRKSITKFVAFEAVLLLTNICYTIVNPSYFLIAKLEYQTIAMPFINFLSIFAYCVIFLSVIQVSIKMIKKPKAKKDTHIINTIYASIVIAILFVVQILHNVLYEVSDIVYSATFVTIFLQFCYLAFTFTVFLLFNLLRKSFKFNISFWKNFKLPHISFRHNLESISVYVIQENMAVIHKATMAIIPFFLVFYLLIALFY